MLNPASLGIASFAVIFVTHAALAQSAACPEQPNNEALDRAQEQTLVIRDPAIFEAGDFSLARTLNAILQSKKADSTEGSSIALLPDPTEGERVALLQSIISSFSDKPAEVENPDSQIKVCVDARRGEAKLEPTKLLNPSDDDGMRPVAIFNRFDLTPEDFRYCGEHRIVYAKGAPLGDRNRFFLIFEAALKNPAAENDFAAKRAACRNVAQFWDSLKTQTPPEIAKSLEQFFYRGLAGDQAGVPKFNPVVHQEHFGMPDGQLRGSLFVEPNPIVWQFREWRLAVMPDGSLAFVMATVKNNPIAELYGPTQTGDRLGGLRDKFKLALVDTADGKHGTYLKQLTAFDRGLIDGSRTRRDELSAGLAMLVAPGFNDFQSDAFPAENDEPLRHARKGGDIEQQIAAKLGPPTPCKITAEHILNRAGAVSCGGCHQFSNRKELAPGVVWPESANFVHVTEDGELSEALTKEFLPARRRILDQALSASFEATPPQASEQAKSLTRQVQEIETILRQLQKDQGFSPRSFDLSKQLQLRVLEARKKDLSQPGAFVPMRRVH